MKKFLFSLLIVMVLISPLSAKSTYFPELSAPLFDYCQRLENSMLLNKNEAGFIFNQCEQAYADDEKAAQSLIEPGTYLVSLRKLDKAYHKSLWQIHLLLRNAIEKDDADLFKRIIEIEERKVFSMNGLLPHALEFMTRHQIEVPYYINPNVKAGVFQHDWTPSQNN